MTTKNRSSHDKSRSPAWDGPAGLSPPLLAARRVRSFDVHLNKVNPWNPLVPDVTIDRCRRHCRGRGCEFRDCRPRPFSWTANWPFLRSEQCFLRHRYPEASEGFNLRLTSRDFKVGRQNFKRVNLSFSADAVREVKSRVAPTGTGVNHDVAGLAFIATVLSRTRIASAETCSTHRWSCKTVQPANRSNANRIDEASNP